MKQLKALQALQASGKKIFTSGDLQKILQISSSTYTYVLASRLVKENVLERMSKGYFALVSNKPSDFELANILYRPSYVSLESALNYYGILIQSPQQITSVSTKLTKTIISGGRMFSYMHLDQKYFISYQSVDGFLIATPEKALIDTMFTKALGHGSLSIEELNLEVINKEKVRAIAAQISNRAFVRYLASIKL